MSFVGSAASARRWLVLLPIAIVALVAVAVAAERNWPAVRDLRLDTVPHGSSQPVSMSDFNGADAFAPPCTPADDFTLFGTSAAAYTDEGAVDTCVTEHAASGAHGAGVLTQITTWRREGNAVVLIRPPGLRHRLGTN